MNRLGIFATVLVSAILLVGCKTAPILNVQDAPVTVATGQKATMASVESAIIRAGGSLGWVMKIEKPGLIVGTLSLRTHVAVVEIPFSATTYSIIYRSSVNLEQQGGNIHSNYNGWITNLNQAIQRQLLI